MIGKVSTATVLHFPFWRATSSTRRLIRSHLVYISGLVLALSPLLYPHTCVIMARPERVPLSSIKTLVLYADEYTTSRRTSPLPQLECTGSACRDFQPSSVYCTKTTDSDWKCEADLPSSLRFGKLHVSCEGWDRPGDPHVLKGSCGLTYSLVRTPLGNYHAPNAGTDYTSTATYGLYMAAVLLALYILTTWLRPRLFNSRSGRSWGSGTPGGGPRNGGGGWPWPWGGGGGRRGGGPGSSNDAPPPYTKYARPGRPNQNESWTPGFWTGLGTGGLAAGMYHYLTRPRDTTYRPAATAWDWDRASMFSSGTSTGPYRPETSAFQRRQEYDGHGFGAAGAGSSTGPGTRLGEMRRATGYAGTSVR
ncbi:oligopeptide transporter, partial [Rhizoctonia solani]